MKASFHAKMENN